MNDKDRHINLREQEEKLFGKGKIAWEKSESEVWTNLEKQLSEETTKVIPLHRKFIGWSVAAIFVLLFGIAAVITQYSKTIECLPGNRTLTKLPDKSTVDLNSGSKLTYYPFKWKFERKIKFEGEGYFKVKKGSKFTVESANGTTEVLGTSFNIFARDEKYRVTCLTGKVKVSSSSAETVVLLPNNHAELENGKLVIKEMFKPEHALGWTSNEFFFAGRPLKEVIDEIERQYAVTIKLQPQLNNRNFVSNFSKKHSVEEVLDFVCKPMNLKFVKQERNVYLVVEGS